MKTTTALAFPLMLSFALSAPPDAADAKDSAPVEDTEQTTTRATVVTINNLERMVTLKDAAGNVTELIVDKGVTRFEALKVGDVVMAGYTKSATFEIQAPGTPIAPDSVTRAGGKLTGAKPGGAAADMSVRTVTITAIDAAAPMVTFKNADGGTETYNVQHPEYLGRFKVGDQVRVTRTKALLMKVEPTK